MLFRSLARLNAGALPRLENLTPATAAAVRSAELTDVQIYDLQADRGETRNLGGRGLPEESMLVELLRNEYLQLAADSPAWQPQVQPAAQQ